MNHLTHLALIKVGMNVTPTAAPTSLKPAAGFGVLHPFPQLGASLLHPSRIFHGLRSVRPALEVINYTIIL
jgi:hypothetical protein